MRLTSEERKIGNELQKACILFYSHMQCVHSSFCWLFDYARLLHFPWRSRIFSLALSESLNFFKVDLMLQQLLTSIQTTERAGKICWWLRIKNIEFPSQATTQSNYIKTDLVFIYIESHNHFYCARSLVVIALQWDNLRRKKVVNHREHRPQQ